MFGIQQRGSTVGREIAGGVTTFLAMSYIIFAQVAILSPTGMDSHAIIAATCLASAVASIVMGLWANYPIALAPGMGANAFFSFTLVAALAKMGADGVLPWKMALAMVAISGVLFLLLSFVGFRTYVLNAVPASIKFGIAVGIGLLIATVGLSYGNLITFGGPVPMAVPLKANPAAWLTLGGVMLILVLSALRVRGAVLISIAVNALIAAAMGLISAPEAVFSYPQGIEKTAGACFEGFGGLMQICTTHHAMELFTLLLVLLLMDLFDTVGTLLGVADRAGLLEEGKLPRANQALAADAAGTIVGAGLGCSTVTSYVESVTGVSVGARTGLAAITTGVLFVAAVFFQPLIATLAQGVEIAPAVFKYPLIAPAMIFVGAMMLRPVRNIDFDDVTEYVPAFLTIIAMPLTMSISHGIGLGFISYAVGKLLSGRGRQCPVSVYIVAGLFVLKYALELFV